MNKLDGEKIYYAFRAGAREVIKERNYLNKINLFPVADGDTGTNLAITMTWIIKNSQMRASAVETFKSIADAALSGARGNSGAIFAQYINGITLGMEDTNQLTIESFATSIKEGVRYAYEAIENPIEGTMLSVIRDWAEAVYQGKNREDNFIKLLTYALEDANVSLQETSRKLEVLKGKGIVDSGAKGFVTFLKGFLGYLSDGRVEAIEEEVDCFEDFEDSHPSSLQEITFKYCTEGLVEGNNINLNQLKEDIKGLGDSLIVAGNSHKAKIHIHTNYPQKLFAKLKDYGTIVDQKAEDMKMQNIIVNARRYKIALVTDSIADLPEELVERYQIHRIALNVNLGKSTYLDRITMTAQEMYGLMKKNKEKPSSSQPTLKSVQALYQYLMTYYDSVIVISVSGAMSGTFNIFNKAAASLNKEKERLTVIDSKLNSGAQGLVVLKAAEAIDQGLSHEEVVNVIESTIAKTKIYVSINDLRGMIRSGRISTVVGRIAKLVNLKPIVSIDRDGKGIVIGKAFSTNENTKQILEQVRKIQSQEGIEAYVLVHGQGEKRLERFKQELEKITGKQAAFIEEVSSIVAMSAGENTVAIALIEK